MTMRDPHIVFQQMLNHAEEVVGLCEGRVLYLAGLILIIVGVRSVILNV
jgi:hypothetical protein